MSQKIEALEPELVGAELAKVERAAGLNEDTAIALRGNFAQYYEEITTWREKALLVTDPAAKRDQKIAREARLGLKKVRCEVENVRKALKADSLARGKAIDGFANILKYLCEPVETKLLEVEQYAERQEAARVAAIVEDRTRALVELEADPAAYNLGAMDDETWVLVLSAAAENRRNRIEAERKAEAERIAREQADRIARQKAEADAAAARAEAEKERQARAKAEAEAKAERAAADAKLKAEREAREKLEREAADAKRKEEERLQAEAEAKRKAEAATDKDKLQRFASLFDSLTIPTMQTESGKRVAETIRNHLGDFEEWIRKQVETL